MRIASNAASGLTEKVIKKSKRFARVSEFEEGDLSLESRDILNSFSHAGAAHHIPGVSNTIDDWRNLTHFQFLEDAANTIHGRYHIRFSLNGMNLNTLLDDAEGPLAYLTSRELQKVTSYGSLAEHTTFYLEGTPY